MTERDENTAGIAYFPESYLTQMLRFFERNRDKVQVITYQDIFAVSDDYDYAQGYPSEREQWIENTRKDTVDTGKAYVLIQYDVDSGPQRTMSLLRHPAHERTPANVMRFAKRVNRRLLKTAGELEYTDYDLDKDLLSRLSKQGFVIGYHSNCYERSHHDESRAPEILAEDIDALREEHEVRFYTAHGGVPCAEGKNNRDIQPLAATAQSVRWVHNGATPFFNRQFSDGGHNSPLRDPAGRDLRDFVARFRRAGRYRILLHPQYYDVNCRISKRYSGTPWYDEMVSSVKSDPDYDIWAQVKFDNFDTKEPINIKVPEPPSEKKLFMAKIKKKLEEGIEFAKKSMGGS